MKRLLFAVLIVATFLTAGGAVWALCQLGMWLAGDSIGAFLPMALWLIFGAWWIAGAIIKMEQTA